MRILIYGAGVIGSLYAVLFSKAGYEVAAYARGRRLQELKTKGLLYRDRGNIQKADLQSVLLRFGHATERSNQH